MTVGGGTGVAFCLVVPFLIVIGGEPIGAGGAATEVTPAQVEGGVGEGTKRSTSFSARNIFVKFKI